MLVCFVHYVWLHHNVFTSVMIVPSGAFTWPGEYFILIVAGAYLITAPVLAMPDPSKRYTVYSDASMYGCEGVLMQEGCQWHTVE